MKISYAITVCNELEEVKRLVNFLLSHKRKEDEIVILFDEKNGTDEVFDYIESQVHDCEVFCEKFEGHFADWKNKLNDYCTGDYIYQIDADEMISEYMVKNLHEILEMNPDVDLIFVPRINTVSGITYEHVVKWGWNLNEKGWVNFPDRQGRIYRKGMSWYSKVHERIVGGSKFASLPDDEEYCIQHHKTIERQEKQNKYYGSI